MTSKQGKQAVDKLTQKDVADIFNVSTTTVQDWQREGLPYKKAERGKASMFSFPIVMFWKGGRRLDKEHSLKLDPLERIVFSHYLDHYSAHDRSYGNKDEYLDLIKSLTSRAGFKCDDALVALGKAEQIVKSKKLYVTYGNN